MPPTPTRRRYVCLGVGGVGGTICAKLAQSGAPVVAIARGEHLRTIQARGLRLRTPAEDVTLPVHALSSASELEPALGAEDVVIVATKSHQALSALDDLARLCEPDDEPAIVCCTNGLNTERASLRCFPRTYGMLVMLGGTHLVAGEVRCFASVVHGWLDIGCYPSGIDPLCKAIAADLRRAEFACVADTDVMALKRTKLLSNVNNCLAAVGGLDAAQQRWLDGQLRAEAVACYAAAGLAYHTSFDSIRARRPDVRLMRRGAIDRDDSLRGGSSTWQSLARGTGNIEVDFLNGEVSLLGRLHGVPTPVNTLMQAVARRAAVLGKGVGSVDAHSVMAQAQARL